MILGVLSDTHGDVRATQAAVGRFQQWNVDEVIHCGDIGSEGVVSLLAKFPTHYVFGNCDDQTACRNAILRHGGTCYEGFGEISREGCRIAFLHSNDRVAFEDATRSGRYNLVCYGHTHLHDWSMVGDTYLLNPGAVKDDTPSASILWVPSMRTLNLQLI